MTFNIPNDILFTKIKISCIHNGSFTNMLTVKDMMDYILLSGKIWSCNFDHISKNTERLANCSRYLPPYTENENIINRSKTMLVSYSTELPTLPQQ